MMGRPKLPDLGQLRRVHRNTRANDDQILPPKRQQPMATCLDRDALFDERRNFLRQLLGAAHV